MTEELPRKIYGEYAYTSEKDNHSHAYLLPYLLSELDLVSSADRRLFDLGCGNGSLSRSAYEHGWCVTGVDPSESAIAQANRAYPDLALDVGSAYHDLAVQYGTFPVVVSLEVVEHVYLPRIYAHTLKDLLEPGGTAIVSTPYHAYLKNAALALTGKLDSHFTALWDHGHIKFWSAATLTTLLGEVGLSVIRIHRIGRVPAFAKSMMLIARR